MNILKILALAFCLGGAAFAEDRVRPIERFAPAYPLAALRAEIQGKVTALLTVDDVGTVVSVDITSESPKGFSFADAAREAFLQWKYPKGHGGRYTAKFIFASEALPLTAEEAALDFAGPPVFRKPPVYPSYALDRDAEGEVFAIMIVAPDGRVESVRIVRENPPGFQFGSATLKALKDYRFAPSARSVFTMTARYRMADKSTPREVALPADGLPDAPGAERSRMPSFPSKARKAGIGEGFVDFGIQIDEGGKITHAGVLAESPPGYDFAANAYKALEFYRFPGDVPGTYRLHIEFKLDD